MFLPGIAFYSFGSNKNNSPSDSLDPEKADGNRELPDVRLRHELTINDEDADDDHTDNDNDNDNDNDSPDPDTDPLSPSHPHRLHRLSSATALTSFSPSIILSEGHTSLWTRFRLFVSPPDAPDVLYIPTFRITPIISGIIIPFSILLEIPGLTEHWYVRTEQNKTVETRRNSTMLDVGLAFSLTCALVANVALVARFLERRVRDMTIICVIFLSIHDLINITAVTVFGVEHRFDDGFTYGQSFWMTVCSTVASTITNLTLIIDLVRTPDFQKSGSGLTRKQRSLVIITIVLLCYIALGALINGLLMHLSFIDGLYFTVCSIETIGFGDIDPISTGARIWVCAYSALGIVNLGVAVGMTRETVLEALEVGYRKRVRTVRTRRRAARRQRKIEARWREAIEVRLRAHDAPVWVRAPSSRSRFPRSATIASVQTTFWDGMDRLGHAHASEHWHTPHGMQLNLGVLSAEELEMCAREAGVALGEVLPADFVPGAAMGAKVGVGRVKARETHARVGRMAGMLTQFAIAMHGARGAYQEGEKDRGQECRPKTEDQTRAEKERENAGWERKTVGQAFDNLRSNIETEERRAFYARLIVAWTLFVLFWFIGSAIFMATEKWEYGTAMYFCFIAFTTIGYGDYSPQTPAGRSVFVVWALLGVGTMTILISILSEAYSSRYKSALHTTAFDKAVKRYRQRAHAKREKVQSPPPASRPPSPSHETNGNANRQPPPRSAPRARQRTRQRAQERLETLPPVILGHTRTLHEHLQFFMSGGRAREMPEDLGKLLDDIAGAAKTAGPAAARMGNKIRQEVLQDDEARQTLFTLSIETALRKIVTAAEEVMDAVAERDKLVEQLRTGDGGSLPTGVDEDVGELDEDVRDGAPDDDDISSPRGESEITSEDLQDSADVAVNGSASHNSAPPVRQGSVTFHPLMPLPTR